MTKQSGKVQRANKQEVSEVREVLKALWVKAFTEGEVIIDYPAEEVRLAESLYDSLAGYRKYVSANQLTNYETFVMVASCSLLRREAGIKLRRKSHKFSNKSTIVLDLLTNRPELGLRVTMENDHILENILKDFEGGNLD